MTQVFILSGTSWTVPSDWSNTNTVETIGGGGGGGGCTLGGASGAGGGGYAKGTNLSSLTAGDLTNIQVGAGGAGGTNAGTPGVTGGDTWFNGTTVGGASVSAHGGSGGAYGVSIAGGAGGLGVNGTTTHTGGSGGNAGNPYAAGGGGGAAGPNGNGGNGGAANQSSQAGGGGGGGNGGGAAGASASGQIGGTGGNNSSGSGGGTAGGGNGSTGGGGGGASGGTGPGNGGNGTEWAASDGSGGGGGGGSSYQVTPAIGGTGGLYGGGGGGSGNDSSGNAGTGGVGAQGIIVVSYTSAAGATITADAWAAGEFLNVTRGEKLVSIESGLAVSQDIQPLFELCGSARGSGKSEIGFPATVGREALLPTEAARTGLLTVDLLAQFEVGAFLRADAIGSPEFASRTFRPVSSCAEWGLVVSNDATPSNETLSSLCGQGTLGLESPSSGARISVAGLGILEWADPPALPVISPARLLRSPGRIRILAGPGSNHPLRGQ